MNVMPNANSIKKAPSHKRRNIAIVVIAVVLVIGLGVGAYFVFFTPKAKTTAINKKVENIQRQIEAIPNLETKENVDKFKKLTKEMQAAQDEQWNNLQTQVKNLK